MTQALDIAASALSAQTVAINTVSENVANAQSPGYVRESANMSAVPGGRTGIGGGVEVSVSQATNTMLEASNWQAQGQLSSLSSLQQVLSSVVGLFPLGAAGGATGPTAGTGIAGQLATFWNSWDMVAQDPSATAPRMQVIDNAESLVASLHQAATQVAQFQANASQQLGNQLSEVNSLLSQVATLNRSITGTGDPQAANQLSDQLRQVLGTLVQLTGAQVRMQPDGTATVTISGVTVVQATTVNTLELATTGTPPRTGVALSTATSIGVPLSGGSVAGLLTALNTSLPQYQAQLDAVATSLKTTVDTQLAAGFTSTGTPGTTVPPLFTGTGAAGIAVSATLAATPSLIAASASATPSVAANDGANAQAMAELSTLPSGPDAAYRTLVQNVGTDTQSVDSQLAAATAVATQAQAALQSVTGVDVTVELTKLLTDQQAFQASAKLLAVAHTTMSSLLQVVA